MHDLLALKSSPEDCELRVRVQNENNREFVIRGHQNETFVDLCKRGTELKDYLECACGGNMTCSTCHVYVKAPLDVGKQATEEEKDMLDLAYEPIDGVSRLGCQLKLIKGQTLVVEIPKKANNYFK